jgi:hypothetical protein
VKEHIRFIAGDNRSDFVGNIFQCVGTQRIFAEYFGTGCVQIFLHIIGVVVQANGTLFLSLRNEIEQSVDQILIAFYSDGELIALYCGSSRVRGNGRVAALEKRGAAGEQQTA